MNHDDHVGLIAPGIVRNAGGRWADLGAGSGAFTLALRDLAGPDVEIIAIDRDAAALRSLQSATERSFPGTSVQTVTADFTSASVIPPDLNGIIIANALHFVRDQARLLERLRLALPVGSRLIVVEYDTDQGNQWVPYPLSRQTFVRLAQQAGFRSPKIIGRRPSRFLGSIYAATADV